MMDATKVSNNKRISRWFDQENLIVINEIERKIVYKDEEDDR